MPRTSASSSAIASSILAAIRDFLLPKLTSGEIHVCAAEMPVEGKVA